jgi:hypothetical protein
VGVSSSQHYVDRAGVLFLLMMRMHAGGGCGMGHASHKDDSEVRQPTPEATDDRESNATATQASATKRSGGCH